MFPFFSKFCQFLATPLLSFSFFAFLFQPSKFLLTFSLLIPRRKKAVLGLPTLAALEQGISVIAVRENKNLMRNDLTLLPWKPNQFHLAENYLAVGDPANALDAIETGLELAIASEEHWTDSELLRMRGVALALRDGVGENDEAEACLRRAVDDARSRSAKSLELRAAISLARFLHDQGRSTEAHDLLSPVYGWFAEGFDTPDLQDAKALLDELS